MTADKFFDPSVARGYAAWIGERRVARHQPTTRERMTVKALLTLALAVERSERDAQRLEEAPCRS